MRQDSIINEIHQIRESYAKQFNFDLKAICADLREKQSKGGRVVVAFPPKRVQPPIVSKRQKAA
jgi:hypothetical protein